jgi:adenylosuccinate synthase
MEEKTLYTVTDLGPGDGGKGGVVHKLCTFPGAHTVIKVGGAQGGHGVKTSRGQSGVFSQMGCGTFEGLRTHISKLFVIEPYRFIHEANILKYESGVSNVYDLVTVDEDALCITPFHGISSKLKELARGDKPKGTVGIGGGEAIKDAEQYPELAIYAKDCNASTLRARLEAVRTMKRAELGPIIELVPKFPDTDRVIANQQLELLNDDDFVNRIVLEFNKFARLVTIVDLEYLRRKILDQAGRVVVESSHGVLTDRYAGFHPHTSYLKTLPSNTLQMINECGYDGRIVKLGISRAYQVRHGAGPLVTESPEMLPHMLPDSSKDENRWQGKIRIGPLDTVALRYAIAACGGPTFFDALAITWFDQVKVMGDWKICTNYTNATDPLFFTEQGDMKLFSGKPEDCFSHQQKLGELLQQCIPNIVSYNLSNYSDNGAIAELCAERLMEHLNVPVKMVSFGPTENDKMLL